MGRHVLPVVYRSKRSLDPCPIDRGRLVSIPLGDFIGDVEVAESMVTTREHHARKVSQKGRQKVGAGLGHAGRKNPRRRVEERNACIEPVGRYGHLSKLRILGYESVHSRHFVPFPISEQLSDEAYFGDPASTRGIAVTWCPGMSMAPDPSHSQVAPSLELSPASPCESDRFELATCPGGEDCSPGRDVLPGCR